jgi:hypothetical protein
MGNSTLLSTLGLQNINLNVSALLPASSCPNGGVLNTGLGLGNNCLGITVASQNGVAQVCGLQNNTCCCSSGKTPHHASLPAILRIWWSRHTEIIACVILHRG